MNTDEIARPVLPLAEVEKAHILDVLALLGGNKPKTARALGISLKGLYLKLNRYKAQDEARARRSWNT